MGMSTWNEPGFAAGSIFAIQAQFVDTRQPHAEEHRVETCLQGIETDIAAERLVIVNGDTPDVENDIQFLLRKIVDAFIGSNTIFV